MPPNEAQPSNAAENNDNDNVDVKFAGKNNDAKIEMGDKNSVNKQEDFEDDDPFRALTKDELMQYAKDPFWVKLRWALFFLFWLVWVGMLVASVVILVLAKKCPSPEPKEWWQKAPVYDIAVKSFKDSDDNGLGDLKGIESKMEYLKSLGVGSVLLDQVYPDNDLTGIDSTIGTMQDFDDLATALYDADIKLILDFVPNHTSDDHEWFQKSAKREEGFEDYYIWSRTDKRGRNSQGGPAWTYNSERGEYYFSTNGRGKPDLNLRNDKVFAEVEKILNFWMEKGVSGFRMDSVTQLMDDVDGQDAPDNLELLRKFRDVLDVKAKEAGETRVMMVEASVSIEELMDYYGTNFTAHAGDIAHMPINFDFAKAFNEPRDITPEKVQSVIKEYLNTIPESGWANFHLSSANGRRIGSRVGESHVDMLNIIMMMLPGTPVTYYGDELGMAAGPSDAAMQWNGAAQAGFTGAQDSQVKPGTDYADGINVVDQDQGGESHLNVYRKLASLRHQQAVLFGDIEYHTMDSLFAYRRMRKGNPGYVVAANMGNEALVANVSTIFSYIPEEGKVEVRSVQLDKGDEGGEAEAEGEEEEEEDPNSVNFSKFSLKAKEAIVVTFVPDMDNKPPKKEDEVVIDEE